MQKENVQKEEQSLENEPKVLTIKTPFDAVEFLYYQAKKSSDGIVYDSNILQCASFVSSSLDSMMKEIEKLKGELESLKIANDVVPKLNVVDEVVSEEIK